MSVCLSVHLSVYLLSLAINLFLILSVYMYTYVPVYMYEMCTMKQNSCLCLVSKPKLSDKTRDLNYTCCTVKCKFLWL